MKTELICPTETPHRSAFLRAWRGEIGLYRAAYGLGGLGLAVASLFGDVLLSSAALIGGATGWLVYVAATAGELTFAWFSLVATWRAARKGKTNGGQPYGRLAVAIAFVFVGLQFVLIAGWTGWSGLAELGFAPDPDRVLIRALAQAATGQRPQEPPPDLPCDAFKKNDDGEWVAKRNITVPAAFGMVQLKAGQVVDEDLQNRLDAQCK